MAKALKKKDVEAALLSKGFGKKNLDHRVFHYYCDGLKTHITTRISHSSDKEIDKKLISAMAHQCRLSKSKFEDLIDCTMTSSDYYDALRAQKEL